MHNGTSSECASSNYSFLVGEQISGFFLLFVSLFAFNVELGSVLVQLHELGEIELGLLEELDLSDDDVLEGEDLA